MTGGSGSCSGEPLSPFTTNTKEGQMALNENAQRLVEALRSGRYRQTRGRLHNGVDNTYCCLGVACEISGLGRWSRDEFTDGDEVMTYVVTDVHATDIALHVTRSSMELPYPVRQWLGFTDGVGSYPDDRNKDACLAELNDSGSSFAQIAAKIESEPPGLFAS